MCSRVCGNHWGIIRKYTLGVCRQCFRDYAKDMGFKKVRYLPCAGPGDFALWVLSVLVQGASHFRRNSMQRSSQADGDHSAHLSRRRTCHPFGHTMRLVCHHPRQRADLH